MSHESFISQQAQGSYIAQAAHGGNANVNVFLPPPPIQEQNRVRFLARLRYYYRELWNQFLQGTALMTLGLSEKPNAVLHHTGLLFLSGHQPERPLPLGTSILQVYDTCGQELLILGEPGAGKSLLLLDLTQHLVERAERHVSNPLPVILPLSSWAERQQPLQEWLPTQLSLIYDVPLQVSRSWVFTNQILPLLDGLDEVPQRMRVACMNAIKDYRKEHLIHLVVCSRRTEYEEIERKHHLILQNAVVVQPLSRQQVEMYLIQAGPQLAAVRTALQTNPVLQELTTTPLMLSVLMLTYRGAQPKDLPQRGSSYVQQQQIFASYATRMVERKGDTMRYSLQSTRAWLGWLARQMQKRNQTVFYLEHMQPSWLTPQQQWVYAWLAVRIPGILIGVLVCLCIILPLAVPNTLVLAQFCVLGALLGGLFSGTPLRNHKRVVSWQGHSCLFIKRLSLSTIIGLTIGLSFGLHLGKNYSPSDWLHDGTLCGSIIGLSSLLLQFLLQGTSASPVFSDTSRKSQSNRFVLLMRSIHGKRALIVAVIVGLSNGLSSGLGSGLLSWLNSGLLSQLGSGLSSGLVFGLISLLISLILEGQSEDIHLTERLTWTRSSLKRSLMASKHRKIALLLASTIAVGYGLIIGLIFGLNFALSTLSSEHVSDGSIAKWVVSLLMGIFIGLILGLIFGLGYGLSYWLLLGLFQGISKERIEDRLRRVSNQGILRSFRNSVLMGIVSIGAISVIGILSIQISYWLRFELGKALGYNWNVALNAGLSSVLLLVSCGILACAVTGGLSTLRHYIIRLLLWRSYDFTWDAPRFLDDATTRILLRRVGGGYSFVHRLILEFFASWDIMSSKPEQSQCSRPIPSTFCTTCQSQLIRPDVQYCPHCGQLVLLWILR